eukprot:4160414-Prorocentrum_lima.AAC.1
MATHTADTHHCLFSLHDLRWHLPTAPRNGSASCRSVGHACHFKQHHPLWISTTAFVHHLL